MSKMRLTVLLALMALASLSAFGLPATPSTDSCANTLTPGQVSFALASAPAAVLCGDKIFSAFTGNAAGTTVTINQDSPTSYEVFLRSSTGISVGFSYGFEVTVATSVCGTCAITQIQQNMQVTQTGSSGKQIPNGATGVNTINNGGTFIPGTTDGLNVGDQNSLASNLGGIDYTLGFTFNPSANSGPGVPNGVFLNLDDIITQTPVPEPMTLSMMGLGLLGLGVMRRRQQGK